MERISTILSFTKLLLNTTKFKLKSDNDLPTTILKQEDLLNRTLRSLKDYLGVDSFNSLYVSCLGYGQFQPQHSEILGANNFSVATNQFTVLNSADFVKEITLFNFNHPFILGKFDIESFFTNMHLHDITNLIVNNTNNFTMALFSFGLD